jgi:hypothetical protein
VQFSSEAARLKPGSNTHGEQSGVTKIVSQYMRLQNNLSKILKLLVMKFSIRRNQLLTNYLALGIEVHS